MLIVKLYKLLHNGHLKTSHNPQKPYQNDENVSLMKSWRLSWHIRQDSQSWYRWPWSLNSENCRTLIRPNTKIYKWDCIHYSKKLRNSTSQNTFSSTNCKIQDVNLQTKYAIKSTAKVTFRFKTNVVQLPTSSHILAPCFVNCDFGLQILLLLKGIQRAAKIDPS